MSKKLIEEGNYSEKNIQTLSARDQIRLRPGMWIGKLGDGSQFDDGEYILFKETLDNSVDEYTVGYGSKIIVTLENNVITIRDYGRGIPLEKLEECVAQINTSGKYNSESYKKVVGLNGVGLKATNFLSKTFTARTHRDGKYAEISFEQGLRVKKTTGKTKEPNGTFISYEVDSEVFGKYSYNIEFLRKRLHNYACLNPGLTLVLNGEEFRSSNGLLDLIKDNYADSELLYKPIRLYNDEIEVVLSHTEGDSEQFTSFVNGQYTSQGGTHQIAYREAVGKTLKDFLKKDYEMSDVRNGIVASIKLAVEEPEFESQTKIRLSSKYMSGVTKDITIRQYVLDFIAKELDDYLVKHPETAKIIAAKAEANMKDRKAIQNIKKKSREQIKKASLNNKKLRDCKVHLTDTKNPLKDDTMIFITEGHSASGSITANRDPRYQAVFSLRGKPLNTFGLKKNVIYENEEFALLSAALDIDDSIDNLRYKKIIIASDADPDGFHIRMLMLTWFVQFFPDLIRNGNIYFFVTPLFRVRNKKEIIYCYNEKERDAAIKKLGNTKDLEVSRFKGLGELGDDMKALINIKKINLEQIHFAENDAIVDTLRFYMGKNTQERVDWTCDHLIIDE